MELLLFDAEQIVVEAISEVTGVDPNDFSMKTKLRGTSAIRRQELLSIVAKIQAALATELPDIADLRTVGELVALVNDVGSK